MIKYHKFLESDQFELTELNTPVNPVMLTVHARYTAGGAAATRLISFLDGERSA